MKNFEMEEIKEAEKMLDRLLLSKKMTVDTNVFNAVVFDIVFFSKAFNGNFSKIPEDRISESLKKWQSKSDKRRGKFLSDDHGSRGQDD